MTDEQRTINRADLDPGACPECGNVNIEGKSIDIEGPEARQKVSCGDCETFWHDVYLLQRRRVYLSDQKPDYLLTIEDEPAMVTRSKGGTEERTEPAALISIPDLWHIAMWLRDKDMERNADEVLETWHLCNDLLKHIKREQ